jgi:hypothetical protein
MSKFAEAHEWTAQGKNFSVQIRAWRMDRDEMPVHVWDVYALVFEGHPLFAKPSDVAALHFHGGPTYTAKVTYGPGREKPYDWEKTNSVLKVGCDYNHLHDWYFRESDPKDGIPGSIQEDADLLYQQLEGAEAEENRGG